MDDSRGVASPDYWKIRGVLYWPQATSHTCCLLSLTLLMLAGTITVYTTGGTAYAYPYLMLIPVLFASAWYGLVGGFVSAFIAGSLMAFMPLEVASETPQSTLNWGLRLGLYLMLGTIAGALFTALRGSFHERDALVRTDPRSKLPNQVAFDQDLRNLSRNPATKECEIGLLVVRITDITDILEAMGSNASDELAAKVGAKLSQLVAPEGQVYRTSISELSIVMPLTDKYKIQEIARKVIEEGEENLVVQNVPIRAQLVLGSTLRKRPYVTINELISEARIALSSAMKKRLSHCAYSPVLSKKNLSTIKLISNVRHGLERGEFELHYQPKLRIADDAVIGCEALIRWRNSEKYLIPPGQFMPKVENTTLITPVTHFVSREACRFLARQGEPVSINFSARNLVDENMPAFLKGLLSEYQIEAEDLEIEVTESALIHDLSAAREAIEVFRELGFGVSIDDFGTGFASFEYLRHLPITGIKIDRAFVRDLATDLRSRNLMACMVDVGHALDLRVTAEGVETEEQYRILRTLGCDQAQGFYFTPALPDTQFGQWCLHYQQR